MFPDSCIHVKKPYAKIAEALQFTLAASSGSETFGVYKLLQQGGTFLDSGAGDALAMSVLRV